VILVDTGPLVAAADLDDADHRVCVELFASTPGPLIGPALIVAEVCYLTERLGVTTVMTLDRRHFSVVRPRHVATFTLLP